jgi:thiol-disulfide isomerase/thioredoxin
VVKNGAFVFIATLDSVTPYKAHIVILRSDSANNLHKNQVLDLSSTTDHLTLKGTLENFGYAKVEGGFYANPTIAAYSQQMDDVQKLMLPIADSARLAQASGNASAYEAFAKLYYELADVQDSLQKEFIKTHADLPYAAFLYFPNARHAPVDEVLAQLEAFAPAAQSTPYGQRIREMYEQRQAVAPGAPLPDFTVTDLKGKELSPAQFRGKYLLIDFWGSWCVWCRKSSPKMVQFYKDYSASVEILGLARERSEANAVEKMQEAIAADGYTWPQANITGRKDILDAFCVTGFPTYVLADPDGIILLSGAGSETLDKAMALLKEKI